MGQSRPVDDLKAHDGTDSLDACQEHVRAQLSPHALPPCDSLLMLSRRAQGDAIGMDAPPETPGLNIDAWNTIGSDTVAEASRAMSRARTFVS